MDATKAVFGVLMLAVAIWMLERIVPAAISMSLWAALLQVDVTANTEEHKALLKRFRLFGPPGLIFFDREGKEQPTRVIGYQPPEKFLQSLDGALK